MRLYAQRPGRVARQLLADVLAVVWVVVGVRVAGAAQDLIRRLLAPAEALTASGEAIQGVFDDVARTAGGVPLVGGELARAFGSGAGAGESLAAAGRQQAETLSAVALGCAIGIVVLGVLPVLLVWLRLRVGYARAAGAALALRATDPDLLALRALAHVPVRRLRAVAPDPAAAWRRGDPAVVRDLAALELRGLGLNPSP